MPSGRTHDRITLWMLPLIVGTCYFITKDGELTLLCSGAFFFSGLMFGPDLDIHSVQFKRWGWLRFLWLPYQKLLRHRSWLSHGFIIGTVVRVIYLSLWLFILATILLAVSQSIWGFTWNWQTFFSQQFNLIITKYWQEAIAIFIGLELGAMSHYLSDSISSYYKRRQKAKSLKPKLKPKVKNASKTRKKPL